jgi:hypothetical protein
MMYKDSVMQALLSLVKLSGLSLNKFSVKEKLLIIMEHRRAVSGPLSLMLVCSLYILYSMVIVEYLEKTENSTRSLKHLGFKIQITLNKKNWKMHSIDKTMPLLSLQ